MASRFLIGDLSGGDFRTLCRVTSTRMMTSVDSEESGPEPKGSFNVSPRIILDPFVRWEAIVGPPCRQVLNSFQVEEARRRISEWKETPEAREEDALCPVAEASYAVCCHLITCPM